MPTTNLAGRAPVTPVGPPRLIGQAPCATDGAQYHDFVLEIPPCAAHQVRAVDDFRDLERGARRSKTVSLPPFPSRRRLKAMASRGGKSRGGNGGDANALRPFVQFTKIVGQVNTWLAACAASERIDQETWWQDFLRGSRRQAHQQVPPSTARRLNQFFTRPAEAQALVHAALEAATSRGVLKQPPVTYLEPAAGAGALFGLFPPAKPGVSCNVGVDIDAGLCERHGWHRADFLTASLGDLGIDSPTSHVVVITNPPFVEFVEGGASRDPTLAARFVAHALSSFGDLVVALLPARFARPEQRALVAEICTRPCRSWLVGEIIEGSKFDLAGGGKAITQPSQIVAFAAVI